MLKYLAGIFSSGSGASFGRIATAVTILTGCGCLVFVVWHTRTLPEAGTMIGLGAWMTAPYAINKGTAIFTRPDRPHDAGEDTLPTVSASSYRRRIPSDGQLIMGFVFLFLALFWLTHQGWKP